MKSRSRRKPRVDARLVGSETPVFLLNARRQIAFFNAGCQRLTGWKSEDVVGRICEYHSDAASGTVDELTSSLCPPPEVLAGRDATVPAYLIHRDGRSVARLLNFFPLLADKGDVQSILCVITAIRQPAPSLAANATQKHHAELAALRISLHKRYGIKTLAWQSEAMQRVLEQVQLARGSKSSVLLVGEPGTGKEHLARLIHQEGEQHGAAFVPLDCQRLSSLEIKPILKRMFEPDDDSHGKSGTLQPGTLYLSHVERLPRDLQQRVIDAVQAGKLGPRSRLRLMAGTESNLQAAVESDALRSDLYYLLTAISIHLPPLRQRREDIKPLAQHLLEDLNRGAERQVGGFSEQVWQQFREYNWPGNLDELGAVIVEARASAIEGTIQPKDLPFRFRAGMDGQSVAPPPEVKPIELESMLEQVERQTIQRVLEECRHNKTKAAKLLGIPRPRLYRRMQALGIEDQEDQ